jgi:NAD(P)-dependent dehydrogenase (short-subunit alcohol dehydrogenase family)
MFSKVLWTEAIKENIPVNCINPGLVQTPDTMATQFTKDGDWRGYLHLVANEHAAIEGSGSPVELAHFSVFVCSDKASYSVGSNYFVDGGMLKTV